jgi:hypothetical protein
MDGLNRHDESFYYDILVYFYYFIEHFNKLIKENNFQFSNLT